MDFNSIKISEDLSQDSHSAVEAAEFADLQKQLRIHAKKYNRTMIVAPQMSKEAANPVSQMEYNARLYALLHIIRNPEKADTRYPLADAWKELYPHIPYNDKATNWNISKQDRTTIVDLLKELGMYKRFVCDSTKAVIQRVSDYYKTQRIVMLEEKVRTLELQLVDNGDILYRGITIKRLTRVYKAQIGDFVLEARHGTFDKMDDFLKQIDKNLA